ncbi:uncharacterized protein VTP21DRAFT_3084 [Calcarisporiella thermophila]|uniref:uncharacterized protein n=1 Tax=Calcarisporiella thermophila TaxID=911321 RepID=UPI0037443D56
MDADAEELHGIFHLINVEDDSGDDAPREEAHSIPKAETPSCYNAKIDSTEWFLVNPNDDVAGVLAERDGYNRLIYSINQYYAKREYADALCLVKKYLQCSSKRRGMKDIMEIAARCCLRLNRVEEAVEYIQMLDSNDPGPLRFKAEVYILAGRKREALEYIVRYHKARKQDHIAWRQTADIFLLSPSVDTLALACLHRAHRILLGSRWPQHEEFSRRRYELDRKEIAASIEGLESRGVRLEDLETKQWRSQAECDFNGEDIDWMERNLLTTDNVVEEKEKSVRDL